MFSRNTWSKILGCAAVLLIPVAGAVAQDTRFTNNQYGVAFQPPPGWPPTILVQYEGPMREDGGHPALNLSSHESLIDIGEQGADKVADDLVAEFSGEGFEDAKILGRRKLTIAGQDALQIDLSFNQDDGAIQIRRVMVPVKQQNRTYIFTLSDNTDHFAETAALGDNAIASFTLLQAGAPAAVPPAPAKSSAYKLLLVLIGLAALAIVCGTAYLLTRKRGATGSA